MDKVTPFYFQEARSTVLAFFIDGTKHVFEKAINFDYLPGGDF
jgi:hypothetical protein